MHLSVKFHLWYFRGLEKHFISYLVLSSCFDFSRISWFWYLIISCFTTLALCTIEKNWECSTLTSADLFFHSSNSFSLSLTSYSSHLNKIFYCIKNFYSLLKTPRPNAPSLSPYNNSSLLLCLNLNIIYLAKTATAKLEVRPVWSYSMDRKMCNNLKACNFAFIVYLLFALSGQSINTCLSN